MISELIIYNNFVGLYTIIRIGVACEFFFVLWGFFFLKFLVLGGVGRLFSIFQKHSELLRFGCVLVIEEEYLSCVFHSSLWVGGSVVSIFYELQLQDCRLGCCVGRACVCV